MLIVRDNKVLFSVLSTIVVCLLFSFILGRYSYKNNLYRSHPFVQCLVVASEEGRKNGSFIPMSEVKAVCQELSDTPYVIDGYGKLSVKSRSKNTEG